ncbi:hypothetical protein WJX73_007223 [Symbiochloris irregularis]|uniref:HVA22-like protein n=1 Tax=Symbiochloris irregularis TaxID=706552 RepID=A0AAW1NQL3_9CHLO
MLGDASTRLLINLFGYLWPAYYTHKAVQAHDERATNKWCIYWLVIAVFTAAERLVLDWTIFWLPLYYEGKLLFVVWLWHSHTQGAQYLYSKVLLPLLNKYEGPIDDSIAEAQTWLMDNFWQYARSRASDRKAGWQTATQQTAVSESG